MSESQVLRAFTALKVPIAVRLRAGGPYRNQAQADAIMEQAKNEAMANFRRLMQAAHPDHGGTVEDAQALIAARDVVQQARFAIQRPEPVVRVVMWPTASTAATTNTNTATWWAR